MYYVIYTGAGKEKKTEEYIEKMISRETYEDCFHPMKKRNLKLRGKWKTVLDSLIPGYIFLESENIENFYSEIKKNPAHLKILGKENGDGCLSFYPLSEQETDWLMKLMIIVPETEKKTDKPVKETLDPVVDISQVGFDENDKVVVISGPLKNVEGSIKKINLHKRLAEVELFLFGRNVTILLGIELLSTKEENKEDTKEAEEAGEKD